MTQLLSIKNNQVIAKQAIQSKQTLTAQADTAFVIEYAAGQPLPSVQAGMDDNTVVSLSPQENLVIQTMQPPELYLHTPEQNYQLVYGQWVAVETLPAGAPVTPPPMVGEAVTLHASTEEVATLSGLADSGWLWGGLGIAALGGLGVALSKGGGSGSASDANSDSKSGSGGSEATDQHSLVAPNNGEAESSNISRAKDFTNPTDTVISPDLTSPNVTDFGVTSTSPSAPILPPTSTPTSTPIPTPQPIPTGPIVSLSGGDSVREGDSITYTVSLDRVADRDVSVDINIIHESSSQADANIVYGLQRVVIKQGQTQTTFRIQTVQDGLTEGNESFRVELSTPLLGTVYPDSVPMPSPVTAQSVIVPAYKYPNNGGEIPFWQAMHDQGGSKIPLVIINPASGPGTQIDNNYVKALAANMDVGIKNIAYISTDWGHRDLNIVKAEVNKYFELYGKDNIHGFFFDETGTLANWQVLYMAELYNYVKQQTPDKIVMANPGTSISDSIAPYADIFVTREVPADDYISRHNPRSAFENDPANASRIMHIIHSTDPAKYQEVLTLSQKRNAGWVYITSDDASDGSQYNDLPANFAQLTETINSHGTPVVTLGTTQSLPQASTLGSVSSIRTQIIDMDSPVAPTPKVLGLSLAENNTTLFETPTASLKDSGLAQPAQYDIAPLHKDDGLGNVNNNNIL